MTPGAGTRLEEIAAPTTRAELVSVIRVGMAVSLGVWLYLVSSGVAMDSATGGAAQRKNLLPFQSVVQDRRPDDQRLFRELQVGLIESQNIRSTSGTWPDVPTLIEQGIEPFAPDPTRKAVRYEWRMQRDGYYVTYRGVPDRPDAPAWLAVFQEPNPELPAEPYQNDEEHARLLDGTVVHVSIWFHPAGSRMPTHSVRVPQGEGWTQVFAVGPSATH